MKRSIGLITGNGALPELIAREAKTQEMAVYVCAVQGETAPEISNWADGLQWIKLGQLGKIIEFFRRSHVSEAVMAGKITKTNLFRGDVRPDLEMIKALSKVRNHSDDSLLAAIADHLNEKGIKILDSTSFLTEETLPQEGVLTKRKPTKEEWADIGFGWQLAKEMGKLDIGQTVIVKKQAVLAVEAIEGTDEAILRGGQLGNGDVVVIKVAKPQQDMRFDVPTIGLRTLDALIQAKARVLAFEAGKTILLDRIPFIEKANEHKLAVVSKV